MNENLPSKPSRNFKKNFKRNLNEQTVLENELLKNMLVTVSHEYISSFLDEIETSPNVMIFINLKQILSSI